LYRLAGLFELADEQFSNIKEEHNLLKEQIKHESTTKETDDSEINLLTLKYGFEKESSVINTIEKIALEFGFSEDFTEEEFGRSYILEQQNEDFSNIAFLSDMLGYKYINEIENNIQKRIDELKLFFRELIEIAASESSRKWYGSKYFFLVLSMLFLLNKEEQLDEFNKKNKWDTQIFNRIKRAINKVKEGENQ
jgi:hypothetical protein